MKHSSTRDLFAYWTQQRGKRAAPARGDIDPAEIRHALGDVFILAADFVDEQRFRLAGTRICALFGRELKGESFGSLWAEASRAELASTAAAVVADSTGVVAGVTGRNAGGEAVELELLILPLAHQGHARIRAIGVLAATELPHWIGAKPVMELVLGTVRHISDDAERGNVRTFLSGAGGVVRRGLVVYEGGRRRPPNEKAG